MCSLKTQESISIYFHLAPESGLNRATNDSGYLHAWSSRSKNPGLEPVVSNGKFDTTTVRIPTCCHLYFRHFPWSTLSLLQSIADFTVSRHAPLPQLGKLIWDSLKLISDVLRWGVNGRPKGCSIKAHLPYPEWGET